MKISDNLAAPCLLIAAMLILIFFRSVVFTDSGVLYTEPEDFGGGDPAVDYITLNDIKYKPDSFFIFAAVSNICAFLFTGAFYVKLKGAGHSKNLKFGLPKRKYLPLCLCMLLFLLAGTVLINALLLCLGGTDSHGVLPFLFYTDGNALYDMGVLVCFVLLPAVCEEFFFRSVIAADYEKHGAFCACAFTALCFAISHFSLILFPSYLFAAVTFYILAKITNSVLFAVFLHMGYNFFCIYFADKFLAALNFEQNQTMFIFASAIIFLISAFFVLNALEDIYYKKAYGNEPSPALLSESHLKAVVRFFKSLLSPTFIAAIVIFFIYINI